MRNAILTILAICAVITVRADYEFSTITNSETGARITSKLTPDGSDVVTDLKLAASVNEIESVISEDYVKRSDVLDAANAIDESKMDTPYGLVSVMLDLRRQLRIIARDTNIFLGFENVPAGQRLSVSGFKGVSGSTVTFDWGDGTPAEKTIVDEDTVQTMSHTYSSSGNYRLKITGNITSANLYINPVDVATDILVSIVSDDTVDMSIFTWDHKPYTPNLFRNVVIPTVTSFDDTFSEVTSLTNVSLKSCRYLSNDAFYGCSGLSSIYFPSLVNTGARVFMGCNSLSEVKFYSGMQVGPSMFEDCVGLTNVVLNGFSYLYNRSFSGCTGLVSFDFSNVTNMSSDVFSNCTGLKQVTLNSKYHDANLSLYGTFNGCTGLTNVVGGAQVKVVSGNVFSNCTSLVSVYLPNATLDASGNYKFFECSNLEYVVLDAIANVGVSFNASMFEGMGASATIKTDSDSNPYKCEIRLLNQAVSEYSSQEALGPSSSCVTAAPTTTKFTGTNGYIIYKDGAWTTVLNQ